MRPTRRGPRGEALVRRVLDVTLEELGRVGLARLSLPLVAERAGIHKTSLYRRWPTKDALVSAALARSVPALPATPDRGDLEQELVDLARGLSAFLTSSAGRGLFRTALAEGDGPDARRLVRGAWSAPALAGPRAVLERAIERGELRADLDLDLVLFTVAGAVLHRTFVERRPADVAWTRRLVRLLVEGAASASATRHASTK